jgi:hypothetical protein
MTTKFRIGIAGITLAAMAGLIYISAPSHAAQGEDLPATVKKIASEFKNNKADNAKKLAADTVKNPKLIEEISDLMHMYRPTDKGGLGIENDLKKVTVKNAAELGNLVHAMAELTVAKGWEKNQGKRTKKAWTDLTEEMRAAGIQLAKADKAADVKTAAEKVTAACNRCHSIFKD